MVKIKFEFPDTGEGVTEGQFLEWKVEVGDEVEEDQIVGEAETDKAVVEIPAPSDGTVEELKASPGDMVEVGDVIMILETDEEEGGSRAEENGETEKAEEKEESSDKEAEMEEEDEVSTDSSPGDILALPKVRKLADEKNVELSSIKTGERITEEEVLDAAGEENEQETGREESAQKSTTSEEVLATPSVRKLAREEEVEISQVEGTGKGGKVTREDVEKAASSRKTTGATKSEPKQIDQEEKREDMSQIRRTIAERMEESRFTAPHVTHFDTADVTELVELREEKKENVDAHLTYLPFIMKAVYLAMKHYPRLNSELDEEDDSVILKGHYDFNIAVDTDRGLMTPKIEDVDEKTVVELAEEVGEKAGEAREGSLSREQLDNGTFSITNIGAIGGEEFTPIINYPQAAILGIGKIQETAEVVDGEVKPRMTVKLSLSYDHRIIDGAEAARFMNKIIENLEDPENMILEL